MFSLSVLAHDSLLTLFCWSLAQFELTNRLAKAKKKKEKRAVDGVDRCLRWPTAPKGVV